MVNGFKPRRSNRLKHLPKVDYCENKTADGKRKRGALDDEDEYTPSREGTPENQKTATHAPENQRSPSRRVRHKSAITKDARQRAVDASQNEGACIISGMKDKSVQQCHVLPRATKPDVLTALEWWWDIEELSVDSRHNQVFRASSFREAFRYAWAHLHTVRADLHALWDRGYIAIMPMPDVMKEYLAKWQDGGRHKVLEASDEAKIHEYCVIPHPDLVAGAPPPGNSPIREGFAYRFDKREKVAAWWGLDKFDVDSPFNIFLLRADIHCLWDQGHLMFVPEPHIIKDYLARSVVPIGGASSLAELFEASDVPVYRYCVVAHRDLPDIEQNAAFPRDVKTLAYVESPVPPQFVIYNGGLMLSKSGLKGFEMALDAFYKRHRVDYEAIDVLGNMLALFQRYTTDMPRRRIVHAGTRRTALL
ncbi:predicted protein [Postia placenta Mad-698-R]|nr:predicted protein [Postia placenta Mad-698-R]